MTLTEMLKGAYDLHIHLGPDVMPRKLDDLEMAARIKERGMKGYVGKSHYFCTADRAALVNKLYPGVRAVGSICLNNAVGGLNWSAVEMAARAGAKVVWLPTVDATNEQEHFKAHKPEKMPYWAKLQMEMNAQGKTQGSISLMDGDGLNAAMLPILDIIAQYGMVLATGHIGREEVFAVVQAATERKVKKIIVTHPDFPSTVLTKAEQLQLVRMGAFIEHCFTTPETGKTTWAQVYEEIRFVGAGHCIISTDLGQPHGMFPDDGLETFANNLLHNDFTPAEIKQMFVENPTYLMEG